MVKVDTRSPWRKSPHCNLGIARSVLRESVPDRACDGQPCLALYFAFYSPSWRGFEFKWACGPPIDMKIGSSLCGKLMGRGRHRSDYTLDKVKPFLSLIGNARFEPIYVAPPPE
jgi:hypothetical protein